MLVTKIEEKYGSEVATTIQKEHSVKQLYKKAYTDLAKKNKVKADNDARERYLSIIFILNLNKNQFTTLYRDACSTSFQAYKKKTYILSRHWQ